MLTAAEKIGLEDLAQAPTSEAEVARRARMILLCADGMNNRDVARRKATSAHTVGRWRAQFLMARIRGLQDAPNQGGRRPISDEQIDGVVAGALQPIPVELAPLSTRQMAEVSGLSHKSVHQIWRSFGIRPHRTTAFNLSSAPPPIDKVWM